MAPVSKQNPGIYIDELKDGGKKNCLEHNHLYIFKNPWHFKSAKHVKLMLIYVDNISILS